MESSSCPCLHLDSKEGCGWGLGHSAVDAAAAAPCRVEEEQAGVLEVGPRCVGRVVLSIPSVESLWIWWGSQGGCSPPAPVGLSCAATCRLRCECGKGMCNPFACISL